MMLQILIYKTSRNVFGMLPCLFANATIILTHGQCMGSPVMLINFKDFFFSFGGVMTVAETMEILLIFYQVALIFQLYS